MAERVELSPSLVRNPELDQWLTIDAEATVTVRTGKVELGQGILTALTLIVADELGVEPVRVNMATTRTGHAPNELVTAGSMSVEHSGAALRQASAWARRLLLAQAAEVLDANIATLDIVDGIIGAPGGNQTVSIWELQGGRKFGVVIDALAPERSPSEHRWVGRGMPRIDLEAKLRGAGVFLQDLEMSGLCHARVIRPPGPNHRLERFDRSPIEHEPGFLGVVVDGSFLAVLAESAHDAIRIAGRASEAARWREGAPVADVADLSDYLQAHESAAFPLSEGVPVEAEVPELRWPEGARRITSEYSRPYLMHASLAPSAAAALLDADGRLTVWSHSQGIELLRGCLARVLRMDAENIHVVHAAGAGSYGHNGADDAALDAALCARALPGRPVLLQWTRAQEHQWEPYGPAAHVRMEAALDEQGRITGWSHDVWGFTHLGRPRPDAQDGLNMLAAGHLAEPIPRVTPRPTLRAEVGIHRNAWPIYTLPNARVVKRFVADSPLRTSSLRGLGAHANVFAIESFMDELAMAAGRDPVEFRLDHLNDPRARAVLERVVALAGGLECPARVAFPGKSRGRGVALARYKNQACYAAVLVQAAVDPDSAVVRAEHVWIAADAGQVIDPDGLINQLEGGAVQSLSWTLKEAVEFGPDGVTSTDWDSYPILRFSEVPEMATVLIDRPEERSLGAGEATQGPTAAALGNAVFAATGLRLRDLPMTPERLRRTAAGPDHISDAT
jgi:CO/xanthine dehydrogenase Mo-binding subunit